MSDAIDYSDPDRWRKAPTTLLVRLIACGAPSPDEERLIAIELDRRIPSPRHDAMGWHYQ